MTCPRILSTQRRIAHKSDAALFVRSSRPPMILGVAIFIAATSLSGCTFGDASVSPQERTSSTRWPTKTASLPSKSASAKDANDNAASDNAASSSTARKPASPLQAWANALFRGSKNQNQTPATSAARQGAAKPGLASQQRVYIDAMSLAQRHPAWRLAQQLAASKSETVRVAFPGAMRRASTGDLQAPSRVPLAGNRVLDAAQSFRSTSPNLSLQSKSVGAARRSIREAPLQNGARRQSVAGLNRFLQAARADQSSARRAEAVEERATLEDELASREIALSTVEPVGLPPAVQLEITNLRLKLLPNANTSAPERAKAQARLVYLQEIWKDKLRAQEEQLLQEWAQQRDEEPRRLRREGEAQIAAQMQRARKVDEARLAQLRDEQQRFLSADFSSREALAVTLPPFSVYQVRGAPLPPSTQSPSANASSQLAPQIRWPQVASPAERVVQPTLESGSASVSLGVNAARARALRAQALQDARGWAQTVARSRGWQLTQRAEAGVPDETRFALQSLGLL